MIMTMTSFVSPFLHALPSLILWTNLASLPARKTSSQREEEHQVGNIRISLGKMKDAI